MSGRGRGRGRGNNKAFSQEQLASLGVGRGENLPGPATQPPPIYPLLNRKPVPLNFTQELDYLLILRQDYIDHMQLSASFLKMPESKILNPENEIDKLVAQISNPKIKFDWTLFPTELRPKLLAKRIKKRDVKKEINLEEKFEKFEALEKSTGSSNVKQEPTEEEVALDLFEDPEDEEMDDGTDYANNYFDNGEAYEDEDDNLDDGPIY